MVYNQIQVSPLTRGLEAALAPDVGRLAGAFLAPTDLDLASPALPGFLGDGTEVVGYWYWYLITIKLRN